MAEFPGGDAAHLSGLRRHQTAVNPKPGCGGTVRQQQKAPSRGSTLLCAYYVAGARPAADRATCPAAPSATIRLFRQLGGHMNLVTGIRFGNVVRLALVFSNGGDFGFGVVQRISGYANRLSRSERDQRQHTGSGRVILRFSWCLSFFYGGKRCCFRWTYNKSANYNARCKSAI